MNVDTRQVYRRGHDDLMDLGLSGRTAFVAAASRGIGRAIALGFAAEGCDVGFCARDGDSLDAVAAEIRATDTRAVPTIADVTDAEAIAGAIGQTVAETAVSMWWWSARAGRRQGHSTAPTTTPGRPPSS
jgi:NAD(P)-dependent dehydrogenase (short-subunit alcohol dehydrogenase family)